MTNLTDPAEGEQITDPESLTTYADMLRAYVASQSWITAAELPLVFHARKIAEQLDAALDAGGKVDAAKDSAYLQVIERLNKRRPTTTVPAEPSELEGQTDLFEFLAD